MQITRVGAVVEEEQGFEEAADRRMDRRCEEEEEREK